MYLKPKCAKCTHFPIFSGPKNDPKLARKWPEITQNGCESPQWSETFGTAWNKVGSGSPMSRPTFWDQFGLGGYPQIWSKGQMAKLTAEPPVVQNRWNSMERCWNRLLDVQADLFGPIGGVGYPQFWPSRARKWSKRDSCSHFWAPLALGQVWGYPPNPNWSQIIGLDMGKPVPTLFHAVPTVSDHWGP